MCTCNVYVPNKHNFDIEIVKVLSLSIFISNTFIRSTFIRNIFMRSTFISNNYVAKLVKNLGSNQSLRAMLLK